jgi:putative ubiquitin-RnfH superfamily antitoxin RatB of RatAB toxin-antitoxin module
MEGAAIKVEVAYAELERQLVVPLAMTPGATVGSALAAALPELRAAFPAVDFPVLAVGVWGDAATPETLLQTGDRVELYRPLVADPKLARSSRVDQSTKRRAPGSVFRR